jgi:hypothetical protein
MHDSPLAAAPLRSLEPRPRAIPKTVRDTITLMVYGRPDDPDCAPLSFIEAAKLAGIKPDQMRRYLDRAEVRKLLLSTRRVFRSAICASNEGALLAIRDRAANAMARVAAIKTLEQIDIDDGGRSPPVARTPGISINIIHQTTVAPPQIDVTRSIPVPQGVLDAQRPPVTIDAGPAPRIDERGRKVDQDGNPIFQPSKSW